jgi:hypothetical protein
MRNSIALSATLLVRVAICVVARCPDERSADHDHAEDCAKGYYGGSRPLYRFRSRAVAFRSN